MRWQGRRRPIAPERPRDAPPIDYGGRHPFEMRAGRKRRLQENEQPLAFQPIRIHFDISLLEDFLQESINRKAQVLATQVFLLIYEILPRTAELWGDALKVIPVQGALFPLGRPSNGLEAFCPAERTSGIPGAGADLWIYVTLDRYFCGENDGGFSTIASALSCERDQHDRPITGTIDFCLSNIGQVVPIDDIPRAIIDVNRNPSNGTTLQENDENFQVVQNLVTVAAHELGHVLGLTSASLPFLRHPITGKPYTPRPFRLSQVICANGQEEVFLGAPNSQVLSRTGFGYEVQTPLVAQVVRNHFHCPALTGALLENQPTVESDCFGSHWDERYFYTELMGAFVSPTDNTLSPLTLAFLEDTSWYRGNYQSKFVANSPFGYLAGCEFVQEPCVKDGVIPSYGEGNFCDQTMEVSPEGIVTRQAFPETCDPSYRYKAYCDLRPVIDQDILSDATRSYFPPDNLKVPNAFTRADYCPIASQQATNCQDPAGGTNFISVEYTRARERYGPDSRCFDVVTRDRAICLESVCNKQIGRLQMKVLYGILITCQYDGEVHTLLDNTRLEPFQIRCPRLAQACPNLLCPDNCSGRGICNYNSIDGTAQCQCFDRRDVTPGCYNTTLETMYSQSSFAAGSVVVDKKADMGVFLSVIGFVLACLLTTKAIVQIRSTVAQRRAMEPVKQEEEEYSDDDFDEDDESIFSKDLLAPSSHESQPATAEQSPHSRGPHEHHDFASYGHNGVSRPGASRTDVPTAENPRGKSHALDHNTSRYHTSRSAKPGQSRYAPSHPPTRDRSKSPVRKENERGSSHHNPHPRSPDRSHARVPHRASEPDRSHHTSQLPVPHHSSAPGRSQHTSQLPVHSRSNSPVVHSGDPSLSHHAPGQSRHDPSLHHNSDPAEPIRKTHHHGSHAAGHGQTESSALHYTSHSTGHGRSHDASHSAGHSQIESSSLHHTSQSTGHESSTLHYTSHSTGHGRSHHGSHSGHGQTESSTLHHTSHSTGHGRSHHASTAAAHSGPNSSTHHTAHSAGKSHHTSHLAEHSGRDSSPARHSAHSTEPTRIHHGSHYSGGHSRSNSPVPHHVSHERGHNGSHYSGGQHSRSNSPIPHHVSHERGRSRSNSPVAHHAPSLAGHSRSSSPVPQSNRSHTSSQHSPKPARPINHHDQHRHTQPQQQHDFVSYGNKASGQSQE